MKNKKANSKNASRKASSKSKKNKIVISSSDVLGVESKTASQNDTNSEVESNGMSAAVVSATPSKSKLSVMKMVLIFGLVFVLGFFINKYKGAFVVAKVNNQFISRMDLSNKLISRYGSEMLDNLITVHLIRTELAKNKIKASDAEVNAKVDEIKSSLNGTSIEDALKMQGLTMSDLKDQLSLQVGIEKYFADKITVSKEEIDAMLSENAASFEGLADAEKQSKAEKYVREDKMSAAIDAWLAELRQKAKIQKYI